MRPSASSFFLDQMIRLFTTCYPEKNPVRRKEYAECLERNLANGNIDEVCILVEGSCELQESSRLKLRPINARPEYADFFRWIGEIAGDEDVSVIANTDIFFDGSIGLVSMLVNGRTCLALARWENGALLDRNDSQDSWVFQGVVSPAVVCNFPLGVVRCDNRILYELRAAGYQVLNPAFTIRTHHLHEGVRPEYGSNEQHYVQPPYGYLWPHNPYGPCRTLWHNLRNPGRRLCWRLDPRRIRSLLPFRIGRRVLGLLRRGGR